MPDHEMSAAEYVASQKRGNKFGAVRTEVDGIVFDSKAEARRYVQLRTMEQGGAIRDLALQQAYDLVVNGVKIATYKADFVYVDNETGERTVEDVKGGNATKTASYRLKRALMKAIYGITITEVQA